MRRMRWGWRRGWRRRRRGGSEKQGGAKAIQRFRPTVRIVVPVHPSEAWMAHPSEGNMKWLLAGVGVAAMAGVSAGLDWAQAPAATGSATAGTEAVGVWEANAAKMEFDVASVKQSKSGDGPNS